MSASHQTATLGVGRHAGPDHGVCVMELASMLAGQRFSDRPAFVSPALAAALRGYNDGLDSERRQTLIPYASACVGTVAGRASEKRRRCLIGGAVADVTAGPVRGRLFRAVGVVDPYLALRDIGHRVAATDDDALHGRILELLDALVDVSRPVGFAQAEAEAILASREPAQAAPA
jgi:hypothetical protein